MSSYFWIIENQSEDSEFCYVKFALCIIRIKKKAFKSYNQLINKCVRTLKDHCKFRFDVRETMSSLFEWFSVKPEIQEMIIKILHKNFHLRFVVWETYRKLYKRTNNYLVMFFHPCWPLSITYLFLALFFFLFFFIPWCVWFPVIWLISLFLTHMS